MMSRPMFAGTPAYRPTTDEFDQERACSQGRHLQPLFRGQCEFCGEFDTED